MKKTQGCTALTVFPVCSPGCDAQHVWLMLLSWLNLQLRNSEFNPVHSLWRAVWVDVAPPCCSATHDHHERWATSRLSRTASDHAVSLSRKFALPSFDRSLLAKESRAPTYNFDLVADRKPKLDANSDRSIRCHRFKDVVRSLLSLANSIAMTVHLNDYGLDAAECGLLCSMLLTPDVMPDVLGISRRSTPSA